MTNELAGLFLAHGPGAAIPPLMGAVLTAWDGATYANTVVVGSVTYTNLPVLNPAGLAVGNVLLANTAGGPIVLGRIYQA